MDLFIKLGASGARQPVGKASQGFLWSSGAHVGNVFWLSTYAWLVHRDAGVSMLCQLRGIL
jgi:hypothetical protein